MNGHFNTDLVPTGFKGSIQPTNIFWNAPFKRHMEEQYEWQSMPLTS